MEHRLAIKQDGPSLDFDLAHAEIGGHPVQNGVPGQHDQLKFVQEGVFHTPETWLRHRQVEPDSGSQPGNTHAAHFNPVCFRDGGQGHSFTGVVHMDVEMKHFVAYIRRRFKTFYARLPHGLQPHRLPDTRGACVQTPVTFPFLGLFAASLYAAARIVESVNDDRVPAGLERRGTIECEGHAAPGMFPNQRVIDIHSGLPVTSAHMKQYFFARPCLGEFNPTAVPDIFDKARSSQAGQRTLSAKRYHNVIRVHRVSEKRDLFIRLRKLPCSVQVQPVLPHQLGIRVLQPDRQLCKGTRAKGKHYPSEHETSRGTERKFRHDHLLVENDTPRKKRHG
ncbi:MAG: hypothetical protein BWX80_03124 [Candidatus Hydrogenedentes bacterium ADurb.Bin101]|nr:MAG: hypothetical protein BWX80_03124 [Candidatus Hydrogenedentes bacterium ADurb.Bin101]